MKKIILTLSCIATLMSVSCSKEDDNAQQMDQAISTDPNFRVAEFTVDVASTKGDTSKTTEETTASTACVTKNLIAGQTHIAGEVTVDVTNNELTLTYTTAEGWTIGATHMSIGNCDEQWVPLTGSENPKIGKFEHSTSHNEGVNRVVYVMDASVLSERYCFAAHAEVSGPTGGETAWAEGIQFDGHSWAMFVESNLSECGGESFPENPVDPGESL